MNRCEEDDLDALGHFVLIGAVAFLCVAMVIFMAWMGWVA
jgi:hypothetical protein